MSVVGRAHQELLCTSHMVAQQFSRPLYNLRGLIVVWVHCGWGGRTVGREGGREGRQRDAADQLPHVFGSL